MTNKIKKNYDIESFEQIKHNANETEFWYARELQNTLEYKEWRNFVKVMEKAKEACTNSNINVLAHFVDVNKMVDIGVTKRKIQDIVLSRYACYLIMQNADPRKEIVAIGQTYFATQTRKQELNEIFEDLSEDEKRLSIRGELKHHNKSLAEAANNAGVKTGLDYAIFQNNGYKGLYGGLGQKEIHNKKCLKKNQRILDNMGSTELAANLFRATQTDEKLRREKVKSKEKANKVHYDVGSKVRQTISDLGGTMPEDLPTPMKTIQQLESEKKKNKTLEK